VAKYYVTYRRWSEFQTVIEADSEEQAKEKIIAGDVDEDDCDFVMADLYPDSIDVMETE